MQVSWKKTKKNPEQDGNIGRRDEERWREIQQGRAREREKARE